MMEKGTRQDKNASRTGFTVRAELRLKNAKLVAMRESFKMKSGEFARFVGISPTQYNGYETMRRYPSRQHAQLLAKLAGCNIEEIFPQELANIAKQSSPRAFVREITMPPDRLLAVADGTIGFLPATTSPTNELVRRLFEQLTPRERRIITLRFGLEGEEEHTLEEVGAKYTSSRESVRNLQKRALQKLRNYTKVNDDIVDLINSW